MSHQSCRSASDATSPLAKNQQCARASDVQVIPPAPPVPDVDGFAGPDLKRRKASIMKSPTNAPALVPATAPLIGPMMQDAFDGVDLACQANARDNNPAWGNVVEFVQPLGEVVFFELPDDAPPLHGATMLRDGHCNVKRITQHAANYNEEESCDSDGADELDMKIGMGGHGLASGGCVLACVALARMTDEEFEDYTGTLGTVAKGDAVHAMNLGDEYAKELVQGNVPGAWLLKLPEDDEDDA